MPLFAPSSGGTTSEVDTDEIVEAVLDALGIINLGDTDPSSGSGVAATVGTLGTGSTGVWVKTGAGNTEWAEVVTFGGGG